MQPDCTGLADDAVLGLGTYAHAYMVRAFAKTGSHLHMRGLDAVRRMFIELYMEYSICTSIYILYIECRPVNLSPVMATRLMYIYGGGEFLRCSPSKRLCT